MQTLSVDNKEAVVAVCEERGISLWMDEDEYKEVLHNLAHEANTERRGIAL